MVKTLAMEMEAVHFSVHPRMTQIPMSRLVLFPGVLDVVMKFLVYMPWPPVGLTRLSLASLILKLVPTLDTNQMFVKKGTITNVLSVDTFDLSYS